MKKYFFTGLVLLLPLALTFVIVGFVVHLLTSPFLEITETLLVHYGALEAPDGVLPQNEIAIISSRILILFVLVVTTLFIGVLGRWVLSSVLFRFNDRLIQHIPVINKIYKATQDVVKTICNSSGSTFSQVVLIPFPHAKAYSMGFISKSPAADAGPDTKISVFMPATPNPTTGFIMTYKCSDVVFIDMKVEDAVKYAVSCGTMPIEFHCQTKASLS